MLTTYSRVMRLFALIILSVNTCCTASQFSHEFVYMVGCFEDGTSEVQLEFDADKMFYVDFQRGDVVYTLPKFLKYPGEIFESMRLYHNAEKNQEVCKGMLAYWIAEEKNPLEEKDPPESVLYPEEEVELGVENSLVCFVNHFYPPRINVSWTKNGHPVLEGVSLSRYFPNDDQTFHQFSTLTFTPREGDIYSCTVEHSALESPVTKFWEPEVSHPGLGPDIFCGVGLTVGLFGVAAGTFLIIKGHDRQ